MKIITGKQCWNCGREARGFQHHHAPTNQTRPACSMECLDHTKATVDAAYAAGEDPMKRKTAIEENAITESLFSLGEAMTHIGWDKPFEQLTEAEARAMAEALLTGFQDSVRAHHNNA